MMNTLAQDFRYAVRMLLRNPSVSLVAIVTLALALGANTAIFSVVQAVLLRPLSFPEPERLVVLSWENEARGMDTAAFSYPNAVDVLKASSFEGGGAYTTSSAFLMDGDEPERIYGVTLTASTLPALGVQPILGRFFTPSEDVKGAEKKILISHRLWQRDYNGDRSVLGRAIRFGSSGTQRTVVGVMPPDFKFPPGAEATDFVIPLVESSGGADLTQRGAIWMSVVARLKDGVSLAAANAELEAISTRLAAEYSENEGMRFSATPLYESVVGDVRPALLVLLASVGAVLLIGCANVANLLLARAAARRREIAVRSALGATRLRIIRQLLVESVVLAVLAGMVGLLLAAWCIDLLLALAPTDIPRIDHVTIDGTVLLFTLGLSLVTGLVFGLVPAIGASRTDLNETLKEGSRGSTEGRGRSRTRNALVIAEIALSIMLLVSAGLLIRSFLRVTSVDSGFDPSNVVQLDLSARSNIHPEPEDLSRFYAQLLAKIAALPGVESAGSSSTLPLDGSENVFAVWPVERPPVRADYETAQHVQAMPGIFETLRIPILAGRGFTPRDDRSNPAVVVVNEAFVREHYPNENPLGRSINITDGDGERQIVGVVADVRFADLATPAEPTVWVSQLQDPSRRQQIVVRTKTDPGAMLAAMRAVVRGMDRDQPILGATPVIEIIRESLARRRFSMTLLSILASLALLLAAVGIYSVMSYSVSQRTSEIGIRMALGADSRRIQKMIVRGALRLVAIGVLLGVGVALASGRVLESFLFGIDAQDPLTLASIALILAAVGVLASWMPARRAARVDPLEAIRYE